ncbi:MAG: YicC family protein, partial [Planctomycetes bacterium]|nr:YicC family protein [Planctomycetota bacterium]
MVHRYSIWNYMISSMTGFGEARREAEGLAVAVEIRTVNNRHFKLGVRAPEGYGALEVHVEELVRRYVNRGTVQVWLRIDQERNPGDFRFHEPVLLGYFRHLQDIAERLELNETPRLDQLVNLPGVVDEAAAASADTDAVWPAVEQALIAAVEKLAAMRADEGRAMAADLEENLNHVAQRLDAVERQAPAVVEA